MIVLYDKGAKYATKHFFPRADADRHGNSILHKVILSDTCENIK